jgi:hypothetical protein
MRAEPDRALGKWLVARAALLVEVRIDADAGGEAALGRQDAVEPRAILDDRPANLEGRLLVVVDLVRELLVRRVVGDQPRRDDVEAAGAAVIVAAGLGDDVDDAALKVVELGGGADGVDLHFLHDVRARKVPDAAVRHGRDVDAVVLELVLIARRAEDDEARVVRHLVDPHRPACR